jgi:hypothetical protein
VRVLLDNNVNLRFAQLISGHEITHVQDIGWDRLQNGDLIKAAEKGGYEAIITCDKNISLSLCEIFGAIFCELNGVSCGCRSADQVHIGKIATEVTPNSALIFTPDNLQSENEWYHEEREYHSHT